MFQDMQEANMEVHMSVTEGEREKCVDIALAVEMLHYATTPGAYDVAVLLTGDKDFMPAMTKTRQRGKRVALATLKGWCNKDLLSHQAHIIDYNPVYLEDSLRELMTPISYPLGSFDTDAESDGSSMNGEASFAAGAATTPRSLTEKALESIIKDAIKCLAETSAEGATARAIGRYLLTQKVGTWDANNAIKTFFGGVKRFILSRRDIFVILPARDLHDPKDFRVALKESFRHLDPGGGEDTVDPCDLFDDVDFVQGGYGDDEAGEGDFDESLLDLNDLSILSDEIVSNMLVPELKEWLRALDLPLTGRKADLVDRLNAAKHARAYPAAEPRMVENEVDGGSSSFRGLVSAGGVGEEAGGGLIGNDNGDEGKILLDLIKRLLADAPMSSRELGRELKKSRLLTLGGRTGLECIKDKYGTLKQFLALHKNVFMSHEQDFSGQAQIADYDIWLVDKEKVEIKTDADGVPYS
mmetsp:Transcript_44435/g.100467  ORF Transcript_44435/g.100467 Transcript_44435/m.100467 type:complete len:469 (-) Transcript_44435:205-1611(-)